MEQLFKTIDVDGNGTIDFEEFLLLFKFKQPRPCEKENTRESEDLEANEKIMRMFDQDGSGFLSPREWLQVRGLICLCALNMALTLICCGNESSVAFLISKFVSCVAVANNLHSVLSVNLQQENKTIKKFRAGSAK